MDQTRLTDTSTATRLTDASTVTVLRTPNFWPESEACEYCIFFLPSIYPSFFLPLFIILHVGACVLLSLLSLLQPAGPRLSDRGFSLFSCVFVRVCICVLACVFVVLGDWVGCTVAAPQTKSTGPRLIEEGPFSSFVHLYTLL